MTQQPPEDRLAAGDRGTPEIAAPAAANVTGLLERLREGDQEAFDRLFPIVYGRLRALGRMQRSRWQGQHSLNTTALVHELYIKLSGDKSRDWRDRAHFLAVSATAMRQILIDHARKRTAHKRGGGVPTVDLDTVRHALASESGLTDERMDALVVLDDSMQRLEAENPRHHRIVECRFFGGMTIRDTAEALGISPATVKRGWSMALAWLYRDMTQSMQGAG